MPDRFFTPKMAWFTPLLCNSCCKVPIMEVEAENFERTGGRNECSSDITAD